VLNLDKTVREVALEMPQATRVFEKLNIDYCCGGHKPLAEACATAGIAVDKVEQMLDEAGREPFTASSAPDFQESLLSDVVGYILETHHVFTKDEMARLATLITKVIAAHGENHPELAKLGELFDRLCADLKPHMFKEERILFPCILEMEKAILNERPAPFVPFGTVNNPVRMMRMEHETAGDLLREMRVLTDNYAVPEDACISYKTLYQALEAFEKDLHQHIHLENNILFPRAIELEAKF
jgi:regulator of cell morphogenesis and NO signaling